MKKILIAFIAIFGLVGCTIGPANTASKAVEEYLDRYIDNSDVVMSELDDYVADRDELNDEQKETYKEILKKQYSDLKYEITDEKYDGDTATVTVKLTVYDLYKVQKTAYDYLTEHADEFKDDDGNYDDVKFVKYKLDQMKDNTDTIEYTLDVKVKKNDNVWEVEQLNNDDLQKIHGIYNYENDKESLAE